MIPSTEQRIVVNSSTKMRGYVNGYEILQNGIIVKSVDYSRIFPRGVPNMVVNSGKDAYGSDNAGGAGPAYVTSYFGRGSGSTPTTATMTSLEAAIGNRSNSWASGHPYTGIKFTKDTGLIEARKTVDFEAESSDQNINEIATFTASTGGSMFSRIVLPATVTVLTGQQLRLTYTLEITISPVTSISVSPTITGWTTDGDARLEGIFPDTTSTFVTGTNTNDFLGLWDSNGVTVNDTKNRYLTPNVKGTNYPYAGQNGTGLNLYKAATKSAFNTWGNAVAVGDYYFEMGGSSSPGTASAVLAPYTNGNYYRDLTVTLQANWPAGTDLTGANAIKCIFCRGICIIFDTAQAKLNTQKLVLVFRVSWA